MIMLIYLYPSSHLILPYSIPSYLCYLSSYTILLYSIILLLYPCLSNHLTALSYSLTILYHLYVLTISYTIQSTILPYITYHTTLSLQYYLTTLLYYLLLLLYSIIMLLGLTYLPILYYHTLSCLSNCTILPYSTVILLSAYITFYRYPYKDKLSVYS